MTDETLVGPRQGSRDLVLTLGHGVASNLTRLWSLNLWDHDSTGLDFPLAESLDEMSLKPVARYTFWRSQVVLICWGDE